jgi:hypothetical protein
MQQTRSKGPRIKIMRRSGNPANASLEKHLRRSAVPAEKP